MDNAEYWAQRIAKSGYKKAETFNRQLIKVYQKAYKEIEAKINRILIECVGDDGNIRPGAIYQNNRLRSIMKVVDEQLRSLGTELNNGLQVNLLDVTKDTYKQVSSNLSPDTSFCILNGITAKAIVNEKYKGAKFSERIWSNNLTPVRGKIENAIIQSCIVGTDWKKASKRVAESLGSSLKDANRLVVTETARVMSESTRTAALEKGYKTYHLLIEPDACDECKKLMGEHFPLDVKLLPIHPHCHCCMIIDIIKIHKIGDDVQPHNKGEISINLDGVEQSRLQLKELGVNIIDLQHIKNDEVLKPLIVELSKLKEEYGIMFNTVRSIDISENTIAQTIGTVLELNQRYFNNLTILTNQLRAWNATKLIPKGCNSVSYVITHEYMHLLTQDEIDRSKSKVHTIFRRATKKEFVSTNSTRDSYEFVADLLTVYRLNGVRNKAINQLLKVFGGE